MRRVQESLDSRGVLSPRNRDPSFRIPRAFHFGAVDLDRLFCWYLICLHTGCDGRIIAWTLASLTRRVTLLPPLLQLCVQLVLSWRNRLQQAGVSLRSDAEIARGQRGQLADKVGGDVA